MITDRKRKLRRTDVFSKAKRSQVMSRIRGSGNKSTEGCLATLLKKSGLYGWRRQYPIDGRPDFAFPSGQAAVFVDGCFWHGCPKCYQSPKQNSAFWRNKIGSNIRRDRRVARSLRSKGWTVIRIRECRLEKSPKSVIGILTKHIKGLSG